MEKNLSMDIQATELNFENLPKEIQQIFPQGSKIEEKKEIENDAEQWLSRSLYFFIFIIDLNMIWFVCRYIDDRGFEYRKKLPIQIRKDGTNYLGYICMKCNKILHYDIQKEQFLNLTKTDHTCSVSQHKKEIFPTHAKKIDLEELEKMIIQVKIQH